MLPDTVRVTLELDKEVAYREERLSGPSRLFFDLKNVQLTPALMDKVLTYGSDVVSKIRVGRHPDNTVRVVLDLEDVSKYSVFTLYSPFRLVIDAERPASRTATVVIPAPAPRLQFAKPAPPPPGASGRLFRHQSQSFRSSKHRNRQPPAAPPVATPAPPPRRLRRQSRHRLHRRRHRLRQWRTPRADSRSRGSSD